MPLNLQHFFDRAVMFIDVKLGGWMSIKHRTAKEVMGAFDYTRNLANQRVEVRRGTGTGSKYLDFSAKWGYFV